jgi:class 3 adenylate cyclase
MEPRIQYAKTKDGVSIAFWTLGEGMPLVHMPVTPFSHVQLEWQIPLWRSWDEELARGRKLIRYDNRGSGLSDRTTLDFSLDAMMRDLEAVVDRLGLQKFALLGHHFTGAVAIAYAAHHPERVSRLILWCSYANGSDFSGGRVTLPLIDEDWETYTELIAHRSFGWSQGTEARQFAALLRECVSPDGVKAFFRAQDEFNVTDLLSQVASPALVLHRRQYPLVPVEAAMELVSTLPNSHLTLLEGASGVTYLDNKEAVLAAIHEFLAEGEGAAAGPVSLAADDIHSILFTDVEGSTALTDRLGDAKARNLLREHERIVREALKAHGGSEVKAMGDGFMTSFSSATKALECAIAMQQTFAAHNEKADEPIKVRIGLNAGEPIAEDEDLFGTAVNLAARACSHAEAGQILVPVVVRELAAGKGFLFADIGETELRGFEDPVRLYEVRWRE